MAVNISGSSQQPQQQTQQSQQSNSFVPQFGISSRLSTYGSGGDQYETLFNSINSKVKFLNEELKTVEKYSVVKLLKQNAGLNYSSIIVCETINDATFAHILMLEKTGDYPEKLVENLQGVRYEIIRTPADALDSKYVAAAQQTVVDSLRVPSDSVFITDGTLVPVEFDVNSDFLVNNLINNTFNAIYSEAAIRVANYKGINLNSLIQNNRNGKFFVNLYFNSDDNVMFDQTGLPVRQDICISLTYKANNSNDGGRSINQGDDTHEIVKTYGYIDFEFCGPNMVHGVASNQLFVPNFIITKIESTSAPTPDILMLGVVSALSINEDMNWMQAFRPTPSRKNEIDYNDIGALNIEANIENNPTGFGKKYDTKSKTFDVAELNRFVQNIVRPNFLVSFDLPKSGPDTWFTSVLQYIKFRGSKEAYDRVNDALVTMTNGSYQSNGIPIFADVTNKIHGGFYRTKDGVRDIRHLSSYLSVANYIADTNQSPMLLSQYTNTLYNSSIPSELRSAERKKYIDEMSNKTAVYKQYYDRVTFNATFLNNVATSMKMIGFSPVFSNMGQVNDMFVRRSTVDFGTGLLGTDARIMGASNVYGGFYPANNYTRNF